MKIKKSELNKRINECLDQVLKENNIAINEETNAKCVTLKRSDIRNMVKEAIEEIKAQTIQNAINKRYSGIENKEKNNPFYLNNKFGDIDRERTREQVANVEKNYNELYCNPYTTNNNNGKRDDFSVSFSNNGSDANYSMNGPAFSRNASSEDRRNLGNNKRFRQWQRDNGM